MLGRLKRLEKRIRIAIIGVGSMGKGLLYQSLITPGIQCVAIADLDIDRAISVAEEMKCNYRVARDLEGVHTAICEGLMAVCEDGDLLARCDFVDALVESSNSIIAAAQFSITALQYRKHLILMNAETDLVFGPYLLRLAQDNDVTYTSCDGDQHGVIKHLIDELELWGFDLVMAGNIKGFLDRYSDPVKIIPEADKRNLGYKMATAYTDGTKLCIEMALVANACGLGVTIPGMQGPRANDVHEVFTLFDFDSIWKSGQPVVDYILGAEPKFGVFAVGHCDNSYQAAMLSYYKMGNGPFYLFYRPYHLCHIEAMGCVAEACLDRRSVLQPDCGLRTNVYAYAKRSLRKGERLDGVGGFTCYGMIDNSDVDQTNSGLPICLADDVTLKRDISKDSKIHLGDINYEPGRLDFDLYFKAMAVRTRA
jgi:predicted homoserine dehydrogenase-like protein